MVQINQMVQGNAARVASVPAPVGGWNARDSIANMEPLDHGLQRQHQQQDVCCGGHA